jgi:hypothetical protein
MYIIYKLINKYIGLYWGCMIIIFTDIGVCVQKSLGTAAPDYT